MQEKTQVHKTALFLLGVSLMMHNFFYKIKIDGSTICNVKDVTSTDKSTKNQRLAAMHS